MATTDINKKSFIPPGAKALLVPLGLLFLTVVLIIAVYQIGISKINSQRARLQKAERDENVLNQKQQVLQSLESEVLSYASTVSIAMPDKNSSLTVISQLKRIAEESGVNLSDIKVANPSKDKKGLSKAVLSIEVEGGLLQVLNYLSEMGSFSPLSTIDKADITQAGGAIRATIDLAVYWAPLPTKLPAISEAVKELSAGESALINEFSNLKQPIFTEVLPSPPSERVDPFAF